MWVLFGGAAFKLDCKPVSFLIYGFSCDSGVIFYSFSFMVLVAVAGPRDILGPES